MADPVETAGEWKGMVDSQAIDIVEQSRTDNVATKQGFQYGNQMAQGRKPRGRQIITDAFYKGVEQAWRKHGAKVLDNMATDSPSQFARMVASLMPKNVKLDVTTTDSVDLLRALNEFRLEHATVDIEAIEVDTD